MTKDNLSILFPERTVEVAGAKFTLRPFSFGEIPLVLEALGTVVGDLAKLNLSEVTFENGGISGSQETLQGFALFVSKHFDKLSYLIAMAAKIEKEEVDALPYDVGLTLAINVFELNKGFFLERVKPLLPKAKAATEDGAQ